MDLEEADNRVPREEVCFCMRESGVEEKYVRLVQNICESIMRVVRSDRWC